MSEKEEKRPEEVKQKEYSVRRLCPNCFVYNIHLYSFGVRVYPKPCVNCGVKF